MIRICLFVFAFFAPLRLSAGELRLPWDAAPSPEVTGYVVYGFTNQFAAVAALRVDVKTNRVAVLQGLKPATWYFAATAYTAQGIESEYSNVIRVDVPTPPAQLRTVLLQYNASLTTTNWQDAGFFRIKIN